MWYQKDWFTGSDYYNLKEKQIHAEEIEIKKPLEQKFHERTEIYYVKSGDADIWIILDIVMKLELALNKIFSKRKDIMN